jgi:hypothetical protein
VSGSKYYLVILDDFTHYLWTFPLNLRSDTFTTLSNLFAYVSTQFGRTVKAIQCDNGREFDNSSTRIFLPSNGTQLRMSCPYTSPQNGKAERIIHSVNNVIRTLLIQTSLPGRYWAEGLHTATYLLNRLPTTAIQAACPHLALFGSAPSYEYLRVFDCTCYPNTIATAPHKCKGKANMRKTVPLQEVVDDLYTHDILEYKLGEIHGKQQQDIYPSYLVTTILGEYRNIP